MKTSEKIIEYLKKHERVTGSELVNVLDITDRGVRKQLNSLLENGILKKEGTPPKVFYSLADKKIKQKDFNISKTLIQTVEDNFFLINPRGEKQEGLYAFVNWCNKRGFVIEKKAKEYSEILKKYKKYQKGGLISGMYKMKKTFKKVFLDEVYYLDFYSIEVFGKTRLGQMMLYAKQSQNRNLIKKLTEEIEGKIKKLIKDKKIDAIGFVPPTVKREVQFIKEIEKNLNLSLPKITLSKIKGEYVVPQKTLNKLDDRIENAKQIRLHAVGDVVNNQLPIYKNILLIDDALGSGATINEIARQIKNLNLSKKVTGLAITGSFSGFEVISEV
ncbi:MAG TPA: DeoR family transcriptional regulator [Candidatus Paceibacterota bacterium]|nr:DeoR family transcriptional regulator [Candidatus Paceibacterota bacterium]